MDSGDVVHEDLFDVLRGIGTCVVSNAIERFGVRLRNTGFADSSLRCMFCDLPPMVGYAATAHLRTLDPPMSGHPYHDRADWWESIQQIPAPRIVVLEDMDRPRGVGALLGDTHAAVLRALGCVGFVTDGAVRELPGVRELGLHVFAGNVAVSHAYAHIFDFGASVHVGGLEVKPGDLLHGDLHGLLTIPKAIAAQIPAVAAELQAEEQKVINFCRSSEFSTDRLRHMLQKLV